MEPWTCPSPGCTYRGTPAIHLLEVMAKPDHKMPAVDISKFIAEAQDIARKNFERDTTVMQAELPVSLFEGQTVQDIRARLSNGLFPLITYADRVTVMLASGLPILKLDLHPQVPTALLTFRWYNNTVPDVTAFWTLLRSYDALMKTVEAKLEFPNHDVVVFKDHERRPTEGHHIPVPVQRPE